MTACRMVSMASPLTPVSQGNCSVSCSSGRVVSSVQSPAFLVFHARAGAEFLTQRQPRSILPIPRNPFLSASQACTQASASTESRGNIVASISAEGVSVASTSAGGEQREELKQKLLAAIEATDGNLNEECVSTINELAKLNPNVGVLEGEEGRKLWLGAFEGVKAGFKGSGKKGEGKAEVGYRGAPATLGRLSFNAFKPADMDVFLSDFFNVLDDEPEGGYFIITAFSFDNPRGPDLPAVDGIIFNRGSYKNAGPDKQEVVFQSSVIRPRFPERDLEVWKEVFAENPGMDEQGQCTATLPGYKGSLDYLYIAEDLRITKGNYGVYVVTLKLPELKPEFRFS